MVLFPIARILWSSNQEVEMESAPLTITCCGPLAKLLFPAPVTLCFSGLEVLSSMAEILLPSDTK